MTHSVHLSERAVQDLFEIAIWIGRHAGRDVARAYVGRIEAACATLASFPWRGAARGDSGKVRSITFERRATVLYRVSDEEVVVLGVYHAGRSLPDDLS